MVIPSLLANVANFTAAATRPVTNLTLNIKENINNKKAMDEYTKFMAGKQILEDFGMSPDQD